ncbi:unnamed protein product [Urochloa humidicola]
MENKGQLDNNGQVIDLGVNKGNETTPLHGINKEEYDVVAVQGAENHVNIDQDTTGNRFSSVCRVIVLTVRPTHTKKLLLQPDPKFFIRSAFSTLTSAQAAHSLPVSSPTLSQIQTLSHGRNSLHCISAAEQPALPLHGSPPLTLPLRRRSCLSLLFCPLSRLMDSRPVQVHGVAGEAQTRCGIFVPSPSRRQRAPPSLVGRHRAPHQATTSKHQSILCIKQ